MRGGKDRRSGGGIEQGVMGAHSAKVRKKKKLACDEIREANFPRARNAR